MATSAAVVRALKRAADPIRAKGLQRFFKTGAGHYGEGDRFLGLRVPTLRALAREYEALPLSEIRLLLASAWHEARLLALLILVRQHHRGNARERDRIFRFYMRSTARINNWDLVDCSAPQLAGPHLLGPKRARLAQLARSPVLWERRIATLATFHGIERGELFGSCETRRRAGHRCESSRARQPSSRRLMTSAFWRKWRYSVQTRSLA